MNTFKWLVNKFRISGNSEQGLEPTSGPISIMGEPCKRRDQRDGRESSVELSISERVQNGKDELQKLGKVYRLQIRSKVPGVIDGDSTIPFILDLKKNWLQVFEQDQLNIKFDQDHHLFRAYGKIITDFTSPIEELYTTYKYNRHCYHAMILPRQAPRKRKRPVGRGGGKQTTPKPPPRRNSAFTSANLSQQAQKIISKTSKPTRTPATRKLTRRQVNNYKKAPSSTSSSSSNEGGRRVTNNRAVIPDCLVSLNHVENSPEGIASEAREARIPFRFQSTSAFNQQGASHRPTPAAQAPVFLTNSGETPQLAFRDESTMAGDIIRPNELELKTLILEFLRNHCSNRDMLSIRAELKALKLARKSQALIRLIPFTAGILQNAFIDDLD